MPVDVLREVADQFIALLAGPTTRPFGLFGLVRERSPTCGADLEDFQWIDSEDPTEAVLMILLPGEDSVIYRRRLAISTNAR